MQMSEEQARAETRCQLCVGGVLLFSIIIWAIWAIVTGEGSSDSEPDSKTSFSTDVVGEEAELIDYDE